MITAGSVHPVYLFGDLIRPGLVDAILDLPEEATYRLAARFDDAWVNSEIRRRLDPEVNKRIEQLFPGTIQEFGSAASIVRGAYDDPITAALWGMLILGSFPRMIIPRGDRVPKPEEQELFERFVLDCIDAGIEIVGGPVSQMLDAAEGPTKYIAGITGSARDLVSSFGDRILDRIRHPLS